MSGVRLLDAVDGKRPDRVDRKAIERACRNRHRARQCSRRIVAALRPRAACGCRAGILGGMPRPSALTPRGRSPAPLAVVVGDLMLDVVLAPSQQLELGTDVPGRVSLRQGGSAATTARWLARLGARATLVCAVGRDPEGRALVATVAGDGVRVRASRVAGERTGRVGVVVAPGGERSFVADRGAADALRPEDLRPSTFETDLVHLPVYTLVGGSLGEAGRRAIEL